MTERLTDKAEVVSQPRLKSLHGWLSRMVADDHVEEVPESTIRDLASAVGELLARRAADPTEALLAAKAALQSREWTSEGGASTPRCLWCKGWSRHPAMDEDYNGKPGHAADCPRELALARLAAHFGRLAEDREI